MDVKSIFLNGYLEEEVCLEQPLDYVVRGHEGEKSITRFEAITNGLI
jgi:hypothetical protein